MKKRLKILPKKVLLISLAIVMAIVPAIQSIPIAASSNSIWINNGELSYEVEGDGSDDYTNGISCDRRDITVTRLRGGAPEDQIISNQCMVALDQGEISSSVNYFIPNEATSPKFEELILSNTSPRYLWDTFHREV